MNFETISVHTKNKTSLVFLYIQYNIIITKTNTTSVIYYIISQFKHRADFGLHKYGNTLDLFDLSILDWIKCAQEDHIDAILYLEN